MTATANNLTAIRAILFDLDGTLQDSYALINASFRHATQTVLGRVIPDEVLMAKVGQPLAVQMWDFTDDAAVQQQLVDVYREHNHRVHDDLLETFPGTVEALARLKAAGFRMGIVTSKFSALAQRGAEVVGVWPYMDFIVAPDNFPGHKPDPAPVAHACELMGCTPEECMYVGDSPFDIASGNGAGCTTVAATWGMFARDLLAAENPTYMLDNLGELADLMCAAAHRS